MGKKNQISVNVDRCLGVINEDIYGFNLEHMSYADLNLYHIIYGGIFENGFRKDVIEASKKIRVPILRWPGGNFASGYHWENGVGPKEKRPRLYELAWKSEESNQFGTDEFIEFCRLVGAEPFITVNAGSGTAEEAAHWVEYCNRKGNTYYAKLREKNGHPEPYSVTYWSIGNEMWGEHQIGHLPADEYAKKAKEYAKLMRLVDPKIKLAAVGGILGNPMHVDWNLKVLKVLGRDVNYLSTHIYYMWVLDESIEDAYYRILACPLHAEKHLTLLENVIKQIVPYNSETTSNRKVPVEIALDEWNISGTHTLGDALGIAMFLNVLQRKCRSVTMSCFFPLVQRIMNPKDKQLWAPITTYKNSLVLEAGYYVFNLYVNHTGDVLLDTFTQSETYDLEFTPARYLEFMPTPSPHIKFEDIPYLDSSASLSKDGKTLYLAVVNANRDKDLECRIKLINCSVEKIGRIYELNGHGIEACNSLEHPNEVRIFERPIENLGTDFTYEFPAHSATIIEMKMR